jgi:hypothetical protein
MGLSVFKATGRAKCKKCNVIIEKDSVDVMFSGYQMERHYHAKCITDEIEKVR